MSSRTSPDTTQSHLLATRTTPLTSFDYRPRTRLKYGVGVLDELGKLAAAEGATRVLLVTDPGIERAGHAQRAVESLRRCGLEVAVFDGVEENPTSLHVSAGVEVARTEGIDFLVGIGGGSSMDCAKGINFVYSCGGQIRDYWGIGKATRDLLPMIAVPTTAGTGSETQSFALISDPVTHQKMACGDARAACRLALLDPSLTLSQPQPVTEATGTDAIAHAVETYVTKRRTPLSMMFAREAWCLLRSSFPRVLEAPNDVEARGRMLIGAAYAGIAIENSMLGVAHAAANPLTAMKGTVHGAAVGIFLPHVVRLNATSVGDDYDALAAASHLDAPDTLALDGPPGEPLAQQLESIFSKTELPRALRQCGVTAGDIPALTQGAQKQWTAEFNPRRFDRDDFEELYRLAY